MQLRSQRSKGLKHVGVKGTFAFHDSSLIIFQSLTFYIDSFISWIKHEQARVANEVSDMIDSRQRRIDAEIASKNRPKGRFVDVYDAVLDNDNQLFKNCSNEECNEPKLCRLLSKGQSCRHLIRAPKTYAKRSSGSYKLRPRRRLTYGETATSRKSASFSPVPITPSPMRTSSPKHGSAPKECIPISAIKDRQLKLRQRRLTNDISLQVLTGAETEITPTIARVNSSSPRDPLKNDWLLNNGLNWSQDLSSINQSFK